MAAVFTGWGLCAGQNLLGELVIYSFQSKYMVGKKGKCFLLIRRLDLDW